jgi:hypothetical protein
MNEQTIPTRQKALTLNLDAKSYGTFAEIGGGQEVSRWFFAVGGAAGTVAETVSAYDKAVSDRLYGHTTRYVSRERLGAMLEQQFDKLREGLQANFGDTKHFFAFADTVATRSFQKGKDSELYPKIWLVETSVQRKNANYFGRFINEAIKKIPSVEKI